MVADEIPIIGTVLDHFQPNQITQIQSGVEKISFGPFWASLGKLGQAHGQITINTVTVFLSWCYIIIQKIIRNGQAVLEIYSNLKNREI